MADHHDSHSDYVPGTMEIEEHKSTYAMFGNMTKWGSLIVGVGVLFLVVLTCVPGAGLFTAIGVSLVLAILGWVMLRAKPDTH